MTKRTLLTLAGTLTLLWPVVASQAQTGATASPPAKKPGLIRRMFGRKKPASTLTTSGRMTSRTGQIIGNKSTKVYHMPGDTGNMPIEKNRVYFRTSSEAEAAGYHRAATRGQGRAVGKKTTPARDPKTGRFLKR